jgi:hypothetical protein
LRKARASLGVTTTIRRRQLRRPHQTRASTVQTVNNTQERLKTWTNWKPRGVATKYLDNYLARMRVRMRSKEGIKLERFIVSGLERQLINLPTS